MTGKQFRAAIRRLKLSQMGAARLLGVDSRTARRWVGDERRIPQTAVIILELMLVGKVTVEDIEAAKKARPTKKKKLLQAVRGGVRRSFR